MSFKKQIKYLFVTLFLTNATYANNHSLSGMYIGGGILLSALNLTNQYQFDASRIVNADSYHRSYAKTKWTLKPNLLIGYSQLLGQIKKWPGLFWAIEFNANFSNFRFIQHQPIASLSQFKLANTYNFFGKIGYELLSNVTGYGLIGASRMDMKSMIHFSPTGSFKNLGLMPINHKSALWGTILGIGIEQQYDIHWHSAIEYQHVFYSHATNYLKTYQLLNKVGKNMVKFSPDSLFVKIMYYF